MTALQTGKNTCENVSERLADPTDNSDFSSILISQNSTQIPTRRPISSPSPSFSSLLKPKKISKRHILMANMLATLSSIIGIVLYGVFYVTKTVIHDTSFLEILSTQIQQKISSQFIVPNNASRTSIKNTCKFIDRVISSECVRGCFESGNSESSETTDSTTHPFFTANPAQEFCSRLL